MNLGILVNFITPAKPSKYAVSTPLSLSTRKGGITVTILNVSSFRLEGESSCDLDSYQITKTSTATLNEQNH